MNSVLQQQRAPFPRLAWCLLAALLLILTGLGIYSARQRATAGAWRAEATRAGEREALAVKDAMETRLEALQVRAARDKATQEVERLTLALAAAQRPPRPLPAPEGDPELVKGLETAGLKVGLSVFRGLGPSSLERQDAALVWDWNAQAMRVPALELRLDASEALIGGQAREAATLKQEVNVWTASSDRWQAAHGVADQQKDALQGEVKALHKAATADRWKTAGEVTLALLLGYLVRGL